MRQRGLANAEALGFSIKVTVKALELSCFFDHLHEGHISS